MEELKNISATLQSISQLKDAKLVFWLTDKIIFGEVSNHKLIFAGYTIENWENYLLRARIFNKDAELHIWKSKGKLWYRLKDNDTDSVENIQFLLGAYITITSDDFIQVQEDTGTSFLFPSNWIPQPEKLKTEKRLQLKTRYYYAYNKNNQASYSDMRFVDIGFF
jgi:CRISPR-associated protein (TIGR03984 family)